MTEVRHRHGIASGARAAERQPHCRGICDVKDAPHPNAARVFVNRLLSKEGQELYVKVMRQSTRRLGVNTKWLHKHGVRAAKDIMTVEQYPKLRNHLEDKYTRVRLPAAKFAEEVIK